MHTSGPRNFWRPEHGTGLTEYFVMTRENFYEDARWAPLNTSNGAAVTDLPKARVMLDNARSEHAEIMADIERQVRAAEQAGETDRVEERTRALKIEQATTFALFTRRTSPVSPVT